MDSDQNAMPASRLEYESFQLCLPLVIAALTL